MYRAQRNRTAQAGVFRVLTTQHTQLTKLLLAVRDAFIILACGDPGEGVFQRGYVSGEGRWPDNAPSAS